MWPLPMCKDKKVTFKKYKKGGVFRKLKLLLLNQITDKCEKHFVS